MSIRPSTARKKRKGISLGKKHAILGMLLIGLTVGACGGALLALTMDETHIGEISTGMNDYLKQLGASSADKMDIFRESIVKYGKLVLIIWFLAFVPAGGFFALLLIAARGAGYGFTTALLVKLFGATGFICAGLLYTPQCILVVPAYLFTAYHCMNYIIFNLRGSSSTTRSYGQAFRPHGRAVRAADGQPRQTSKRLPVYAAVLVIGSLPAVLAALVDTFIVPGLVSGLF